jgi:UrcA family protein
MNHPVTSRLAGSRAKFALLLIASSLGGALGAGAASAATDDSDVPKFVVRYNPESLASDSGVRDLYRRIVSASKRVCAAEDVRDLRAVQEAQACRERAVSRAIEQINNAQLAALHASGSKNS